MFCQKKQKTERLPPTSDSLLQHIKRTNYQSYIWRCSLTAFQDLSPPEGHGWEIDDGVLVPVLMTKDPAPISLLELNTCKCTKSECRSNCSCKNTGLACTEACSCMADESCRNEHNLLSDLDDDSDGSDDE